MTLHVAKGYGKRDTIQFMCIPQAEGSICHYQLDVGIVDLETFSTSQSRALKENEKWISTIVRIKRDEDRNIKIKEVLLEIAHLVMIRASRFSNRESYLVSRDTSFHRICDVHEIGQGRYNVGVEAMVNEQIKCSGVQTILAIGNRLKGTLVKTHPR
eukprot:1274097-Amorphochlora_amoeboformis.AAC.1